MTLHIQTCPICQQPIYRSKLGTGRKPPHDICEAGAWHHGIHNGESWLVFWVPGAKPKKNEYAPFTRDAKYSQVKSSIIGVAK